MKNQFDELAKGMAQSVTRRQAMKKFGVCVVGMALTSIGLTNVARAAITNCLPAGSQCVQGHGEEYRCCQGLKCVTSTNPNGGGLESVCR